MLVLGFKYGICREMSPLNNSTKNMENMRNILVRTTALVLIVASCIVVHTLAAGLNSIPLGGTVYLGEDGLDITAAAGASNQVAWFPSTAQSSATTPQKIIDVGSSKLSFYVNPSDFALMNGNWYQWPSPDGTVGTAVLAFRVTDPYLALKIEDTTVNVDVTGKWAPQGDELKFRIESNLGDMTARGVAGAPVSIKVQTPEGAVLSAFADKTGTYHSLDITVSKSPELTAWAWDTGNAAYAPGAYTIWAECNANHMKDNYNQVGKTVSAQPNLQVQEENPAIRASVPSTTTPIQVTTTQIVTPATTVITKVPTTVSTSTAATPPPTMSQETPEITLSPPTSPAPTKAALAGWCTILAGIIACSLCARWRR
jgi:hypothetical protein